MAYIYLYFRRSNWSGSCLHGTAWSFYTSYICLVCEESYQIKCWQNIVQYNKRCPTAGLVNNDLGISACEFYCKIDFLWFFATSRLHKKLYNWLISYCFVFACQYNILFFVNLKVVYYRKFCTYYHDIAKH